MRLVYYFIQKEGIYPQGVYWIGRYMRNGLHRLNKLAQSDTDNYHRWVLYRYRQTPETHVKLAEARKK